MRKSKPVMKPIEARTINQICALPRDNVDSGDWCILIGANYIYISEQKLGETPRQSINITRRNFDALVRWYMTGSKAKARELPPRRRKANG